MEITNKFNIKEYVYEIALNYDDLFKVRKLRIEEIRIDSHNDIQYIVIDEDGIKLLRNEKDLITKEQLITEFSKWVGKQK